MRNFVITNEHVATNQDGLRILDINDVELAHSEIFLSTKHDVAAILLTDAPDAATFHIYRECNLLDDIMIMGYPRVPTTDFSYQVVHRGEVNSFVRNFWQRDYIVLSAKTSGGNSGGPVVNELGMVIGIVTEQLFEKGAFEERGQLPYYAAVPSKAIIDFLNEEVIPRLNRGTD